MGSHDLHAYFLNNGSRRLHKWAHYFDIYEKHFARYRGTKPTVLEIGVHGGGSLEMWVSYFGEGARIIGLDIDQDCKKHEATGAKVYIGSQDDPEILRTIVEENGPLDIVIDDGSHRMEHLTASFRLLYPSVKPFGTYFVEDLHTCYWPGFGGGLKREGSFLEMCKDLIDELNAFHARGAVEITPFTRSTASISFYDSCCVFEKQPQGQRLSLVTQTMTKPDAPRPAGPRTPPRPAG